MACNQARSDAAAWRQTGPRVVLDGVAYRLKDYGWIDEATGRYVVRNESTAQGIGRRLDALHLSQQRG